MNLKFTHVSRLFGAAVLGIVSLSNAHADENLFGYVKGSETLPKGAWEFYQFVTVRSDKGSGHYGATDSKTELEYGVSNSFTVSGAVNMMAIDTSGLMIDGYLPRDKKSNLRPSGVEMEMKYNFLSPAKDDFGLSGTWALEYNWIDPHSGQNKYELESELGVQAQKYFAEGQAVWVGNAVLKTAVERRQGIDGLPPGFDWPTNQEVEVAVKLGTGISYRFAPGWSAGVEAQYDEEHETDVGLERWSLFAGPTLHYANQQWWATATWFPQITGGGEKYPGQPSGYHLIEKTKQEVRFKLGYNF